MALRWRLIAHVATGTGRHADAQYNDSGQSKQAGWLDGHMQHFRGDDPDTLAKASNCHYELHLTTATTDENSA